MKKLSIFLILLLCSGVACNRGRYSDVKETYDSIIEMQTVLAASLNKAQSGKEVATAINRYNDELTKVIPRFANFEKKYPELVNMKSVPDELKETMDRLARSKSDLMRAEATISKYHTDPEVSQAIERQLTIIMQQMQQK